MPELQSALNWKKAFSLTLIFAVLITLCGLHFRELESGDETRVAGIAAEMFLTGDFLIPRLNGTPFLEYPPLYYWCDALAYSMFGINDFAAKLPSALAAVLCGLLVFLLGRKMRFSPLTAFFTSVILMTSAQFFGNSRKCMVDMLLAFDILLAVASFYFMRTASCLRCRIVWFLLTAAGITGGIYTKGLLGLCIPGAVLGAWLFFGDLLDRKFSWRWYLVLGGAGIVSVCGAAVWYWKIRQGENGEELFHTAFFVNNLGRLSGSQGDHVEPCYYYLRKLPELFQPWLILVFPGIWFGFRKVWREHDRDLLLLLTYLLVPLIALNLSASKRVVYLLPLTIPAAMICGAFLRNLPESFQKFAGNVMPFLTWKRVAGISLSAALLLAAADSIYGLATHRKESLRGLFAEAQKWEQNGKQVILISAAERTRGAAFFYLHHRLPERNLSVAPEQLTPPDGEVWIVREKRKKLNAPQYGDSHWILCPDALPPPKDSGASQ